MILLMCCWIQFVSILLRIFVSIFISDIGLYFCVCVVFLSGFCIRVIVASHNERSVPFASFRNSLRRIDANSSLIV